MFKSSSKPTGVAPVSPLSSVRAALNEGARSRADLCKITELTEDVVDAALEHLVRLGLLQKQELGVGCPGGGCGSCPTGSEECGVKNSRTTGTRKLISFSPTKH